jgi:hypothetical protein
MSVAESRQPVEMVDHVLSVEDALGRIAFDANGLGALRADGKHDGAGAEPAQLFHGQIFVLADRDVA